MCFATQTLVVKNPEGLHARPADRLARLAMQFESTIEVVREDMRVDAKSILHLLTLGVSNGSELTIEATGPDAEVAVASLAQLVENNFADEDTAQSGLSK